MKKYHTLGGWLMFILVVNILIALYSASTLIQILLQFSTSNIIPIFITVMLTTLYGFYSYCILKPSPKSHKNILYLLIAIGIVNVINVFWSSTFMKDSTYYIIQSLIYFAIYYFASNAYFTKSARVSTYFNL